MASILRGFKYLFTNRMQFCDSMVKNFLSFLPDKLYLSLRYRFIMGHSIDWEHPQTFSEKIQWLKVNHRHPKYTTIVDKYAVKDHVTSIIGAEYVIPTLGVWDTPEDMEWDTLPNQFVLKTTHGGGGGGVIICNDKGTFDKKHSIAKLINSLNQDIYLSLREWPYKDVPRRIIAEQFIAPIKNVNADGLIEYDELLDYKFFCFNGKVKFYKVDFGRFIEHHANYYSTDGQLLEFGEADVAPDPSRKITLPQNMNEMIALAERLSSGEPFMRVDFYNIMGQIYFGEITLYPASGLGKWTTPDADKIIGSYLDISELQKIYQ